jgi:uncharacterized protein
MSSGRAEKCCEKFKIWVANPGLCGRCAWPETEHKGKQMQPHQKRALVEKHELDEKLDRLGSFLTGEIMRTLPDDEQARLRRQYEVMRDYSNILESRIEHF